jgi:hypothetical protein
MLKNWCKKKRKKNQLQNDKTFIKNMMLLHLCTKKKLLLELNIIMHKKQKLTNLNQTALLKLLFTRILQKCKM